MVWLVQNWLLELTTVRPLNSDYSDLFIVIGYEILILAMKRNMSDLVSLVPEEFLVSKLCSPLDNKTATG